MANDAINRNLNATEADPFSPILECGVTLPGERLPRCISEHDQRCFDGINSVNKATTTMRLFDGPEERLQDGDPEADYGPVNVADESNLQCARDHKWRLVYEAQQRRVCFCAEQYRMAHEVYRLWKCTGESGQAPSPSVVEAQALADASGGVASQAIASTQRLQCRFAGPDPSAALDDVLWDRVAPNGTNAAYANVDGQPVGTWDGVSLEWFLHDKAVMLPLAMDASHYYR